MKALLQPSTDGSNFLKIQLFLVTQILQDMRMIISMKKETCNVSFICLKILNKDLVVMATTPMEAQQALAKLQRRNR
jgi:hypothetical protein